MIYVHKGLYQYNRLPYGVASFRGIWRAFWEGFPTCVYTDDILITEKTDQQHFKTLDKVLT